MISVLYSYRLWAVVVASCALLLGVVYQPTTADNGEVKQSGEQNANDTPSQQLAMELKLSKQKFKTSENLDVEVVFHNRGKSDLYLPISPARPRPFFTFVMFGDEGSDLLMKGREMSFGGLLGRDGFQFRVETIRLPPGESHTVHLKNALALHEYGFPPPSAEESFKLYATYCDYTKIRGDLHKTKEDEQGLTWRGMVMSAPVNIQVQWTLGLNELGIIGTGLAKGDDPDKYRDWVPELIQALEEDRDPRIRRGAANLLGFLGEGATDAIHALTLALSDEDDLVQREAAEALKRIKAAMLEEVE